MVAEITRVSIATALLLPTGRTRRSCQDTQQLRLQAQRHVADLVEKHGTAIGVLEQTSTLAQCAGKRPLGVTEELGFQQRFGNRRAVDRHEFSGTLTGTMDSRASSSLPVPLAPEMSTLDSVLARRRA